MAYLETTIVVENNAPHHFIWPVTSSVNAPVSLMTDIATPPSISGPTHSFITDMPSSLMASETTYTPTSSSYYFSPTSTDPSNSGSPTQNQDKQNRNVIIGSILGGVLGFCTFFVIMICFLNYFRRKRKNLKKHRIERDLRQSSPRNFLYGSHTLNGELLDKELIPSINEGSMKSLEYGEAIPVISLPVPYITSPFHSQELLSFKPIDPKSGFSQHKKRPSSGGLTDYSVATENQSNFHETGIFYKHAQNYDNGIKAGLSVTQNRASVASSEYSPISFSSQRTQAQTVQLASKRASKELRSNLDPFDVTDTHTSSFGPHSTYERRSTHSNRNVPENMQLNQINHLSGIYDDGRGLYPEFEFNKIPASPFTPNIPPPATLQRRKDAIQKINAIKLKTYGEESIFGVTKVPPRNSGSRRNSRYSVAAHTAKTRSSANNGSIRGNITNSLKPEPSDIIPAVTSSNPSETEPVAEDRLYEDYITFTNAYVSHDTLNNY